MAKSKETKHGNDRRAAKKIHGRANSGADQGGSVGAEGGASAFASGAEPRSIFAHSYTQAGSRITAAAVSSKAHRREEIANAIAQYRVNQLKQHHIAQLAYDRMLAQMTQQGLIYAISKSIPSDFRSPTACAPGPITQIPSSLTPQEAQQMLAALQSYQNTPQQVQQMMALMQQIVEPPQYPWADIKHEGIQHVGEIVAYRCWQVGLHEMLLRSTTSAATWMPGEVMAGDVDNPNRGVHAYKHMGSVFEEFGSFSKYDEALHCRLRVYGRVKLWGEVREHSLGYRAEFAKPYAFDGILPSNRLKELEFLRDRYFPKDPPPIAGEPEDEA